MIYVKKILGGGGSGGGTAYLYAVRKILVVRSRDNHLAVVTLMVNDDSSSQYNTGNQY